MSKYFDLFSIPDEARKGLESWLDNEFDERMDAQIADRCLIAYPKDGKLYVCVALGDRPLPNGTVDGFFIEGFLEEILDDADLGEGDFAESSHAEQLAATFERWAALCRASAKAMKEYE